MAHWLLKSDPDDYGFADLVRDKTTSWTGVSNPQALSFLRQMKPGDDALIYHTGDDKCIMGMAKVTRAAYPDPNADDPKLVAVDLKVGRAAKTRITLAEIKADPAFAEFLLVRNSRLSVMPVPAPLFKTLCAQCGL